MDREWQETFRNRMRGFEARRAPQPGEATVSIKVRVASGCFHHEHSPRAYELIDRSLTKLPGSDGSFAFEEHESGPEILLYLAVTTAGLSLAKSIVDLITAIIKARSEGIKKGDHPSEPLELIVRRVHDAQEFREETVLRIGHKDTVDDAKVERQLKDALRKLLKDKPPTRTTRKKQ
ncbi:MAG: hypothetical protein WA517_07820 [Candidatus Acidiferrum sp.]